MRSVSPILPAPGAQGKPSGFSLICSSHTASVSQLQAACDNCGARLVANAAYCERCGARTRRARRLVRLAIRVELVFFLLVVALVIGFTWVYAVQK